MAFRFHEYEMKATLKNVVIDNANEDFVAFAQSIDFTELFDHIKAFANVNCDFYPPEITTRHGDVHISFMSEDITNQTGVFATILECCYIHSFSNRVFKSKDTEELGYWVSVSLRYEHKDGGSNGMEMVHAWYHSGEWEFRDVGQKRARNGHKEGVVNEEG